MSNFNIPLRFAIPIAPIIESLGVESSKATKIDKVIGDNMMIKPEVESDFWLGSYLISVGINK